MGTGQEIILLEEGERYQGAGIQTREQIKKGVPLRLKGPNHQSSSKQQLQTIEHTGRKGIKETVDIIEEGSTVEVSPLLTSSFDCCSLGRLAGIGGLSLISGAIELQFSLITKKSCTTGDDQGRGPARGMVYCHSPHDDRHRGPGGV